MSAYEPCCGNCCWWDEDAPPLATGIRKAAGSAAGIGTCHASPPFAETRAGIAMSLFPETHRSRRCAAFLPDLPDGPDGGEEAEANNVIHMVKAA